MLVEDPEEVQSGLEPELAHHGPAMIDALVKSNVLAPPSKVIIRGRPNSHRGLHSSSLPRPSHPGPYSQLTGRGAE
jgi:hypothetical protein